MRLAAQSLRRYFTSRMATKKVELTEQEWQVKLTPQQFHMLREKGTERPGTGTELFSLF